LVFGGVPGGAADIGSWLAACRHHSAVHGRPAQPPSGGKNGIILHDPLAMGVASIPPGGLRGLAWNQCEARDRDLLGATAGSVHRKRRPNCRIATAWTPPTSWSSSWFTVPRVAVIGSANVDFTVALSRLPRPGETVSGGTLLVNHGGKGANQAVAARRLGAEVRMIGCIGLNIRISDSRAPRRAGHRRGGDVGEQAAAIARSSPSTAKAEQIAVALAQPSSHGE
jgi:hypothetical protein